MPDRATITERVVNALELTGGGHNLQKHAMWQVCELLRRLVPSDLTAAETMALVTILAHAHERKLIIPRPFLRIVPFAERRERIVI